MLKSVAARPWWPHAVKAGKWSLYAAQGLFFFWVALQGVYLLPPALESFFNWLVERRAEETSALGRWMIGTVGVTMVIGVAWFYAGLVLRFYRRTDAPEED